MIARPDWSSRRHWPEKENGDCAPTSQAKGSKAACRSRLPDGGKRLHYARRRAGSAGGTSEPKTSEAGNSPSARSELLYFGIHNARSFGTYRATVDGRAVL